MAWDWTADPSKWIYAIEVEYIDADGEPQTARWCGPKRRCGSGVAAAIGGTEPKQWQTRLQGARHSQTIGGLRQHVQAVSSLSVQVDLEGDGDLLRDLRDGYWTGRHIAGYFYDMETKEWVERFSGRVRRGMEIEIGSARLGATAGPSLAIPWPMTQMPPAPYNETVDEHQTDFNTWPTINFNNIIAATGAPGFYWEPGVRDYAFQASIFAVGPPPFAPFRLAGHHVGKYVGQFFGNGSTVDHVWREVVPYGTADDPVAGIFWFFHVSPQYGCYVHELSWLDTDASPEVLREATDTAQGSPNRIVQTFNNYEPSIGPLGTCCRMYYNAVFGAGVPEFSGMESSVRFYARVSGPEHDVDWTDYSGAIEVLTTTGYVRQRDDEVIEDIFESLGLSAELGATAISDFANSAEQGPLEANNYRLMISAVPLNVLDSPPLLRDVLGDLLRLVGADIVQKEETAGPGLGHQRLYPVRRRPSPSSTTADWTLRQEDLLQPNPGLWSWQGDPEADYANEVRVTSPEHGTGPGSSEPCGFTDWTVLHSDAVEQDATHYGDVVADDEDFTYWTALDEGVDGFVWVGSSRSQPQPWVRAVLGPRYFAIALADTVGYEVDGLSDDVGQVREIAQDWDRLTTEVSSVHVTFFEGAGRS